MFVRAQHGGERADLALSEAVVEAQLRQALAELFEHGQRHDRSAVVGLAQSAEVARREVRVVGEADPHGGRREETVGAARFDGVEDLLRVRAVQDGVLGADREIRKQKHMHLGGVVERQRVQRPVALAQIEGGDGADVLVDERPVGHHRALGLGGGARGVEQLDQVFGPGLPLRGEVAGCTQLGQQRAVRVAQGPDGQSARQPGREIRVGEDEGAARLLDDVGEIVAGEVLVDRDMDESRACAAEEADEIRVGVVAKGGDPVPRAQAVAGEDGRRRGDGGVEFRVAPGPVRVAQGGAVGGALRGAPYDGVDCVAAYSCHGAILGGGDLRVKASDTERDVDSARPG